MTVRAHVLTASAVVAAVGLALVVARSAPLRAAVPPDPMMEAAAAVPEGFVDGAPGMQSAGALAFGPDGVLFVGDSRGGAVYALAVDDRTPDAHKGQVDVTNIDKRIAKLLGTTADEIVIRDMAVNPATQHVFLSVSRGRGAGATPAIVRSTLTGELTSVPLDHARYAKLSLSDAPAETAKTPWGASARAMAITDLAFTNGELFVAGLSNEAFASTLRRARFPFAGGSQATTVEIYHTSHGKYETASPIETFLPFTVRGKPSLLAGYGCAPLAVFDMAALGQSKHVRGRTLAELGGGSRPNDMVAIERNGERSLIIANSDRTVMRMKASDIDRSEALEKQAAEAYESFGTPYRAVSLVGVMQLDVLNPEFVLMVIREIDDGTLNLRSFPAKYL